MNMKTPLPYAALFLSLSFPVYGQSGELAPMSSQEVNVEDHGVASLTPPDSAVAARADAPLPQTSRILGIIPNFRSVSANTILPPQSAGEKLKTGFQDSFDYSSFVFAGLQAGISQATDSYPVFRQGAAGFGRYYWHTFVDQADENLWVESIIPAALHEDSRYYTRGCGGVLKRTGYALSRAIITRDDRGDETFNAGEIVGAGAAAGISSAYYPEQYRTWTKTGQRWLTNVVLDGATFVAKEFWPNINRAIFHSGT
jgi:hypothetical protein